MVDKRPEMTPQELRKAELRARKIIAAETRQKAVAFRKLGMTYDAIGKQLGISPQAAHKTIEKAMVDLKKLTREDAETIRMIELEKLDSVEMGMWPGASKGNHNAANTILKAMDQRAKHLGLYAPEKHANTDSQGDDLSIPKRIRDMSDEELQARLKELREDLGIDGLTDP